MKLASWTLQNYDGCPKSLKWSSQSRPNTPPYMICWEVGHIIDISWVCGAVGARRFGSLCRRMPPDAAGCQRIKTDWTPLQKTSGLEA